MYIAAEKLSPGRASDEYPFEPTAHPMLRKIADIAFDIAEDYRTEEEDETEWELLKRTFHKYENGEWETTVWGLRVNYGVYEDGTLVYSYSTAISRSNGELVIESGSDTLKKSLEQILAKINPAQTDERFLQNALKVLPNTIDKLRFANAELKEYPTESYYTTHG